MVVKPEESSEFLIKTALETNRERSSFREISRKILGIPEKEFDPVVHNSSKKYSNLIDCTACGNCCKSLNPPVREDEIGRLAASKKISIDSFKKEYLHRNSGQEFHFIKKNPCLFLSGKKCSIYSDRPDSCASYPHLDLPGQKFRFSRTLDQYSICPIVFHVVNDVEKTILELKEN